MSEYRTLRGGDPRPPTWAERERSARLREEGIEGVYLEPEEAPQGFWDAAILLTTWHLASPTARETWEAWDEEMVYNGIPLLGETRFAAYEMVVRHGEARGAAFLGHEPVPSHVSVGQRLSAIEHLLDVIDAANSLAEFATALNDRARYYRLGLRMEAKRFVPVTAEHLHQEIVEPTLLLLADSRLAEVDGLYRKAFSRALSGDPSGAITAATSAVEEMLRLLLPQMRTQTLGPLAEKARADGLIAPSVEALVKELYAFRPDSDAHAGGTSDFDLAMLALHVAGSILVYLRRAVED